MQKISQWVAALIIIGLVVVIGIIYFISLKTPDDIETQIQRKVDNYVNGFPGELNSHTSDCWLYDKNLVDKNEHKIVLNCAYSAITRYNETHDKVSQHYQSSGGSEYFKEFYIPYFEPIDLPNDLTLVEEGTNKYTVSKLEI